MYQNDRKISCIAIIRLSWQEFFVWNKRSPYALIGVLGFLLTGLLILVVAVAVFGAVIDRGEFSTLFAMSLARIASAFTRSSWRVLHDYHQQELYLGYFALAAALILFHLFAKRKYIADLILGSVKVRRGRFGDAYVQNAMFYKVTARVDGKGEMTFLHMSRLVIYMI